MNQNRLLTAFFDNMADAQRAVDALAQIGIPRSEIQMTAGADATSSSVATSTTSNYEEMGFWASLKSLFVPEEDRHSYAEGLRRGGYLVSLHPSEAKYDQAVEILDGEGTVNLDEREESWRSEGWAGFQPQAGHIGAADGFGDTAGSVGGLTPGLAVAGMPSAAMSSTTGMGAPSSLGTSYAETSRSTVGEIERGAALHTPVETSVAASSGAMSDASLAGRMETAESTTGFGAMGASKSATAYDAKRDTDEVIPVMEEQLRVGKREVDQGRVRVRSYVVETPVQEQVNLTSERVTIDRRPVDRPVDATMDAFRDRTIEATEMTQVPVVSKDARITEEVTIKKDVETRTETVADKVRSTKVEVVDERVSGVDKSETTYKP